MSNFIGAVQDRVRSGSRSLFTFGFRLVSGFLFGLVFALAGDEVFKYSKLMFWLVLVVCIGIVLRISKEWTAWGVVLFDLICVLIGLLLRMYIFLAPG